MSRRIIFSLQTNSAGTIREFLLIPGYRRESRLVENYCPPGLITLLRDELRATVVKLPLPRRTALGEDDKPFYCRDYHDLRPLRFLESSLLHAGRAANHSRGDLPIHLDGKFPRERR